MPGKARKGIIRIPPWMIEEFEKEEEKKEWEPDPLYKYDEAPEPSSEEDDEYPPQKVEIQLHRISEKLRKIAAKLLTESEGLNYTERDFQKFAEGFSYKVRLPSNEISYFENVGKAKQFFDLHPELGTTLQVLPGVDLNKESKKRHAATGDCPHCWKRERKMFICDQCGFKGCHECFMKHNCLGNVSSSRTRLTKRITAEGELIPADSVKEAEKELGDKTEKDIEKETAIKWGARYLAARNLEKKDAVVYYYEALEHASAVGDVEFFSGILKELGPDPLD